jgi:hypothetical protein
MLNLKPISRVNVNQDHAESWDICCGYILDEQSKTDTGVTNIAFTLILMSF